MAVKNKDKEASKRCLDLIIMEIGRLYVFYYKLKRHQKYFCTLCRKDAKDILLTYLAEEDITKEILTIYPEEKEDLEPINRLFEGPIKRDIKHLSRKF